MINLHAVFLINLNNSPVYSNNEHGEAENLPHWRSCNHKYFWAFCLKNGSNNESIIKIVGD